MASVLKPAMKLPWGETWKAARLRLYARGELKRFDDWVERRWRKRSTRLEGEGWAAYRYRMWCERCSPEQKPVLVESVVSGVASEDLAILRAKERERESG